MEQNCQKAVCIDLIPSPFHLFFHHPPQRSIDPRLVASSVSAEPRQHIGVQPQRDWLLNRLVELHHFTHRNPTPLRWIRRGRQAENFPLATLSARPGRRSCALPGTFAALRNSWFMFHVTHYTYIVVRTQLHLKCS